MIEAYNISPYKNEFNFFEVDKLVIPFKKDAPRIMIWASGGADSSLLTHLLCEYIIENKLNTEVHLLQFARKWIKAPWQEIIGNNVFNYFKNKFKLNFIQHSIMLPVSSEGVLFIDKHSKKELSNLTGDNILCDEYCTYLSFKHNIDINYNATSKNPPVQFDNRLVTRDAEYTGSIEDSDRLIGKMHPTNYYNCNPFIFTDKEWIIKQYKDRKLIDLLNITRSCEGHIKDTNYINWNKNIEILEDCNNCFWCKERNWALKQNNLLQYKNKFGKVIINEQ